MPRYACRLSSSSPWALKLIVIGSSSCLGNSAGETPSKLSPHSLRYRVQCGARRAQTLHSRSLTVGGLYSFVFMAQGTELITASRTARSEIGAIRCHLNSSLTHGYQRPFFLLGSISLVRTEADK